MKVPTLSLGSKLRGLFKRGESSGSADAPEKPEGRGMRILRRFVLYPLFFLVCFVLFAYLTFPYERVSEVIVQEVENPRGRSGRSPSGYKMRIVDLQPSWFTGVELTGVQIEELPDPEDPEALPAEVTFERIHARISLLSLILGKQHVTFEARVGGGNIAGEVELAGEARALDLNLDSVRMDRITLLGAMLGLPVKGTVTGHVRANLAEERSESTGEIDLTLAGFVLGNGVAKLRFNANAFTRAGLTIPETSFGDVELEAALENGSFNITRLQGRGDDIELDGEGQLQVRNTLGNSTLDAALRIGFAGDFRSENEGLFLALDNVPRVRAAKTPDGDALQFNVRGNIGPRLRFQGAGRAPRPGGE